MFGGGGSRLGLGGSLLPWQPFKYFSVLNFLIKTGKLLNRCYYSCIFISCQPRPGLEDYETPSMRVCACICHIFKSTVISLSFMKISTPNLQRMFMAVKTCL